MRRDTWHGHAVEIGFNDGVRAGDNDAKFFALAEGICHGRLLKRFLDIVSLLANLQEQAPALQNLDGFYLDQTSQML